MPSIDFELPTWVVRLSCHSSAFLIATADLFRGRIRGLGRAGAGWRLRGLLFALGLLSQLERNAIAFAAVEQGEKLTHLRAVSGPLMIRFVPEFLPANLAVRKAQTSPLLLIELLLPMRVPGAIEPKKHVLGAAKQLHNPTISMIR